MAGGPCPPLRLRTVGQRVTTGEQVLVLPYKRGLLVGEGVGGQRSREVPGQHPISALPALPLPAVPSARCFPD